MKGLQKSLLLGLAIGLVVVAFMFPTAFAQELKGEGVYITQSLKAYVPLMIGLGVGLAYFIGICIRKS
ncbi:MAG: hypothetical protein EX285_00625 [Thaumarchaeota archaeon]|nr:hypothetical protein [Nitrososphaerota archaeon]NMJ86348.1 hypothetical protein [Nitrososphaerota archaeon]